jgi:hypothetical protein
VAGSARKEGLRRYDGYVPLKADAGRPLQDYLRGVCTRSEAWNRINERYRASPPGKDEFGRLDVAVRGFHPSQTAKETGGIVEFVFGSRSNSNFVNTQAANPNDYVFDGLLRLDLSGFKGTAGDYLLFDAQTTTTGDNVLTRLAHRKSSALATVVFCLFEPTSPTAHIFFVIFISLFQLLTRDPSPTIRLPGLLGNPMPHGSFF